ncbi:ArnT family glycosyltransferase [Baekduia sp. Peel2402]|uniref:ArnT family glycosyltransferase n=1 Tax=Baekduia sp. Peel2402 TaxID=3458296 RepID=UPI00403E5810
MRRIHRDRRSISSFAPVAVAAVWLVGVAVVYFAPGFGRPLTGLGGVPLRIGHPDFAAVHQIAAALLIVMAGYGLGAPVAARLIPEVDAPGWARAALATVVGFGLLGVVLLAIAGLGIYRPAPVIALLAVCAALALPSLARLAALARRPRPSAPRLPRVSATGWGVVALFAVALGYSLAGALAPEVGIDPLWYHLGFPHHWLATGHLNDFPLQYTAVYPFSTELLYGGALALDGDVPAQLLHLVFGVLLVAGTIDLGRRLFSPRAGVVGGLVLATAPMVMWQATTAHVDLASAAFAIWAVNVAVATRPVPTRRAAVAVGVLLAFALSAKLVMAFVAPGLVLLMLWGAPQRAVRDRLIDTVVMGAIAPLAALPYLIRAEVLTGNPFFPSFYDVFGAHDGRWTADSERGLDGLLQHFGAGHGVERFLTLPWDLTMKTGHFDGTYGLLFLVLIPFAVRLRPRRLPLLVALTAFLYVFCWFFVGRTLQARFLVPAFALAAPLAGAGFESALTLARRAGRPAATALTAAVALLLVLMLPPFLGWWDRERDQGHYLAVAIDHLPLPFLLGGQTRSEYLDRYIPIHGSDRVLAKVARPGDRVLSIDSWIDNSHTDVEHAPYFAAALGRIYDPTAGDAAQMALLRRWHLRFIVINRAERDSRPNGPIALLSDRFVARHLRLVHRDARSLLYEVRDF